jgi:hypothetical protein
MARRRKRDYEPLGVAHVGTLLAEALRDPARIRAALGVWPAWEEAVGPEVAAAAKPVSLREGVLMVHVRHSVWLQELQQQKAALLKRVQALPGGAAVRDEPRALRVLRACGDRRSRERREGEGHDAPASEAVRGEELHHGGHRSLHGSRVFECSEAGVVERDPKIRRDP